MLEKERKVLIMDKLRQTGFVLVRDLMKEMNASRSSIMRDLISLEQEGMLVREHGGASLESVTKTMSRQNEPTVYEKAAINADEKEAICKVAAEHVQDGNCIYIDSGTTTACLLPYLMDKDIIVVTPSIYLIRRLPEHFKGTVYVVGGQYDSKYDMNMGDISSSLVSQFNFDIAFFSANGINLKTGDVALADFRIAGLKKTVMNRSMKNFLLVDEAKLNQTAACTFADICEFDAIYTNDSEQQLPENFVVINCAI